MQYNSIVDYVNKKETFWVFFWLLCCIKCTFATAKHKHLHTVRLHWGRAHTAGSPQVMNQSNNACVSIFRAERLINVKKCWLKIKFSEEIIRTLFLSKTAQSCYFIIWVVGWCPGNHIIATSDHLPTIQVEVWVTLHRLLALWPDPGSGDRELRTDKHAVILAAANAAGDLTVGLQGGYRIHVVRPRVQLTHQRSARLLLVCWQQPLFEKVWTVRSKFKKIWKSNVNISLNI